MALLLVLLLVAAPLGLLAVDLAREALRRARAPEPAEQVAIDVDGYRVRGPRPDWPRREGTPFTVLPSVEPRPVSRSRRRAARSEPLPQGTQLDPTLAIMPLRPELRRDSGSSAA